MSQIPTYKESLTNAIDCLDEAEGHAVAAATNIALAGPYRELGSLFEVGEMFEFDPAMFEDTGDANIDIVLKVVADIAQAKESIRNLNSLVNDESASMRE